MQPFKWKGFYFFFYYVFNGDVLDWFFIKTYPIMDKVIGNVSFDRVILYRTACHVLRPPQGNALNAAAIVHRHCHTTIQARMLHTAGSRSRKTTAHLMRPDLCCEIGFATRTKIED
jgi:hypothetical protein